MGVYPGDESASGSDDPSLLTTMHVRRAQGGDLESLRWVVERLSPVLLSQARYRLRGPLASVCDPEDLVNEVWMRTLPHLERIGSDQARVTPALVAYLSRALLARANGMIERHLRGQGLDPNESRPEADELPDGTVGVVTRVVRDERNNELLTAIDGLAESDREILVLRAVEQSSNGEVAELLGLAPSAVTMRYKRAMERLHDRLPGSVFDELDAAAS